MDDAAAAAATQTGPAFWALAAQFGVSLLGALLILIAGFWVAGRAGRFVGQLARRSGQADEMLAGFLGSLAKYAVLAATGVAVLQQVGVQTASLIALLASAGLAIGLALQGTLSQLAAGVMLLLFRPFTVGHTIDAGGVAGTVKGVGLFTTEMTTADNVDLIVPNGSIWGAVIMNYSTPKTRRIDFVVGVDYADDMGKALRVALDTARADARVLTDPAPESMITALGVNAVDVTLRVWCAAADYWALKHDLTRALKARIEAEGLTIPFPQQTVRMIGPA